MSGASTEHWPARLSNAIARTGGFLREAIVIEETASTQDAARSMKLAIGQCVIAGRQTAGRGRMGRAWLDTGDEGLAMTFVVAPAASAEISARCAVATAMAIESVLGRAAGIKWPNDIMVGHRKIAGILVEQTAPAAYIGIGINVAQRRWSDDLAASAVSLGQLGLTIDRIDVAAALIQSVAESFSLPMDRIVECFIERDVLRGSHVSIRSGERLVSGIVQRVDPMRGVEVRTDAGDLWVPAATATIERWRPAAARQTSS